MSGAGHHEFRVLPQFCIGANSNLTIFQVPVMYDTGSSMQTFFMSDLQLWGFDLIDYVYRLGPWRIEMFDTANGLLLCHCIKLEMRVVDCQSNFLLSWMEVEVCLHNPLQPGSGCRLSGNEIRQSLFTASGRGVANLIMAKNKTSLLTALPA